MNNSKKFIIHSHRNPWMKMWYGVWYIVFLHRCTCASIHFHNSQQCNSVLLNWRNSNRSITRLPDNNKRIRTFVIFNNPAETIVMRSLSWRGISCSFSSLNQLLFGLCMTASTHNDRTESMKITKSQKGEKDETKTENWFLDSVFFFFFFLFCYARYTNFWNTIFWKQLTDTLAPDGLAQCTITWSVHLTQHDVTNASRRSCVAAPNPWAHSQLFVLDTSILECHL